MVSTSHRTYRAKESYRDRETDRRYALSNRGSRVQPCACIVLLATLLVFTVYTGFKELKCALSLNTRLKTEHTVVEKCHSLNIWNSFSCLVTWSPTKRPYNCSLRPDISPNSSASCTRFGAKFVLLLRQLHNHLVSCYTVCLSALVIMVDSSSVDKYDVLEQIGMRQYNYHLRAVVKLTANRQRIFRCHSESQEKV